MTFDPNVTKLTVYTRWQGRRESPDSIADRLRAFLDHIGTLDDSLAHWSIGRKKWVPYATARRDLAALVEQNVFHDEMGKIDRNEGYSVIGGSKNAEQGYDLIGGVGGTYGFPMWNRLWLCTTPGCPPNPKIVTYALFKELFITMIGCWQPAFAVVDSNEIPTDQDRCGWFREAWMTYVPPKFVDRVDLVGVPFSERTPDGGLLLSATEQLFRANDPTHREGARRIAQALQPLNAMLPRLTHPFDWPTESEWMSNG